MAANLSGSFSDSIHEIGNRIRARVGDEDLRLFKRLKNISRIAEIFGRVSLQFVSGPLGWFLGLVGVSFHLSLEAQLNHTVMHGAFTGLAEKYETLAIPFQSKTWGEAHRIHHANPSLLEEDPDTVHPLFRIHESQKWKFWHAFNTFIGTIFVFECWAFDYDQFLKRKSFRPKNDNGEIFKFFKYIFYQFLLFPVLAGSHWKMVLAVNLLAVIVRNFVFVALQTGSSVGHQVSTKHPFCFGKKSKDFWYKFQIETSKNFVLRGIWRTICGGLDRHIEHHLFPRLPPNRLYEAAPEIKKLCTQNGVQYQEFNSFNETLKDSVSYLWKLSK